MAKTPQRDAKGRLKKGYSGNPSGRPKTAKLTQKDKNELRKVIAERDISKVLEFLCERAETIQDAFKYVKEFAPYLAPKLQTINSINKKDTTIEITWKSEIEKKLIDVDAEYEKLTGGGDSDVKDAEIVQEDDDPEQLVLL